MSAKKTNKLDSIALYLNDKDRFAGLDKGLLITSNLCKRGKNKENPRYNHHLEEIEKAVAALKLRRDKKIVVISIKKELMSKTHAATILGQIRAIDELHTGWDIKEVRCKVFKGPIAEEELLFYPKAE